MYIHADWLKHVLTMCRKFLRIVPSVDIAKDDTRFLRLSSLSRNVFTLILFLNIFGFFFRNRYCSTTRGIFLWFGIITAVVTRLSGEGVTVFNRLWTQFKCLDTYSNVFLDKVCVAVEEIFLVIDKLFCNNCVIRISGVEVESCLTFVFSSGGCTGSAVKL